MWDGEGRHPLHPLWKAGGLCGPSRLDGGCAARLLRAKTPVAPFSGGQRHGRQNKKRRPLPSGSHRRISRSMIRHNEEAPLQVSSQPCNSTALAPRKPLCPNGFHVHDLPSQKFPSNGGVTPAAYAASVISLRSQCRPRWVFDPKFLLSCCLTMSRRCNKQPRGVPELDLSNFSRSPDAVFFQALTPCENVQNSTAVSISQFIHIVNICLSEIRGKPRDFGALRARHRSPFSANHVRT